MNQHLGVLLNFNVQLRITFDSSSYYDEIYAAELSHSTPLYTKKIPPTVILILGGFITLEKNRNNIVLRYSVKKGTIFDSNELHYDMNYFHLGAVCVLS